MPTPEQLSERVKTHLFESMEVKWDVANLCVDSILAAANLITGIFKAGGKVLLCGNGGSAADCQHMATELVSSLTKAFERPGLPAIALTTDTSFLTAFSNDFRFEDVFARQVRALGKSAGGSRLSGTIRTPAARSSASR